MEPNKITCFTPAAFAASICSFCPSQSTCSGMLPLSKQNAGRACMFFNTTFLNIVPGSELNFTKGVALVQITRASQPNNAHVRELVSASVRSPTNVSTGLLKYLSTFALVSSSVCFPSGLTKTAGVNCCSLSNSFRTTIRPVFPVAPVTNTFKRVPSRVSEEDDGRRRRVLRVCRHWGDGLRRLAMYSTELHKKTRKLVFNNCSILLTRTPRGSAAVSSKLGSMLKQSDNNLVTVCEQRKVQFIFLPKKNICCSYHTK
mmetsp:Transcript_23522/g.39431  ORF Transcript_23522/g.39431 Transcript_23522/m.39431 type:complete len:258 (+) Transcript_23522:1179-1952(+)